ncbi:MAG: MATE family efflux transporter [Acidobacteria bacterium]|nr:MAG: MATE family efflux transporter [Acidobacteriota bacterium]
MRDLTHGPISKHIVAMAVPIAVGMLVQTLYYLVDLYFVSRLGAPALAGVSAAGNAMFLVLAMLQMLNVGTIAVVSHAVGRKDRQQANLAFNQAVGLAAVLGAAVLAGGYALADDYMGSIGADAATVEAGLTYLRWFIPGLALQFTVTAQGAALQGTGIVKPTMVVQMVTVLLNVALTPVLVAGWGTGVPLGVKGAALSSLISIAAGVVLMSVYFLKLERYVRFDAALWRPRPAVWKKVLGIGFPVGGEFALLFVYMAAIYAVIADFGASAQAGFGVGVRVMQAIFLPAMAVAFATPAIAGQNFGARSAERVRATFRTAAWMNAAIMALLTLLCRLEPEWLVASFASNPEVLRVAAGFIYVISLNFVANGLIFTCSGMFQGMGNTWPALASTTTRIATFVLPAFWLARQPGFRLEHVWYLSVATVGLQCVLSLSLLHWQLDRRLRFAAAPAAP